MMYVTTKKGFFRNHPLKGEMVVEGTNMWLLQLFAILKWSKKNSL